MIVNWSSTSKPYVIAAEDGKVRSNPKRVFRNHLQYFCPIKAFKLPINTYSKVNCWCYASDWNNLNRGYLFTNIFLVIYSLIISCHIFIVFQDRIESIVLTASPFLSIYWKSCQKEELIQDKNGKIQCVKSVQKRSFFWSLFSCIRTKWIRNHGVISRMPGKLSCQKQNFRWLKIHEISPSEKTSVQSQELRY